MLIDHMKRTFAERCRKNSSYSLRAFARSLGMDSSTVSALLNGKRPLTMKTARKIVEGLNITNPVEAHSLIVATFAGEEVEMPGYTEVAVEVAEAISSWEHFAILALLEIKDFRGQDRLISERLNIPLGIVWECLSRLEKLGMVTKEIPTGWTLTGKNMATSAQTPNGALREGHRQTILKSLESLESDPLELRDMSGITMAVNKARLPEARKMIQDFRRRLSAFMEVGGRDSVYRLNIQLFPFTKERSQ